MTALIKYPFTNDNESLITDILSENQILAFQLKQFTALAETHFQKKSQIKYT